jgi:hypothetical protein
MAALLSQSAWPGNRRQSKGVGLHYTVPDGLHYRKTWGIRIGGLSKPGKIAAIFSEVRNLG